jgi:outer membrane biosynthesis protein TonB
LLVGAAAPHKESAASRKEAAAPTSKEPGREPRKAAEPPPEDLPTAATPLTEAEQKAQAEASIDANGVRLAVKQHLPQVKACYERAFKESSPGGTVEVAFAIDAEGRATRVRTESNSTDSDTLARCLESAVAGWRFPRPVGGEYELIYPFVFSPGS